MDPEKHDSGSPDVLLACQFDAFGTIPREMKTAYELALEKMQGQGIEPPSEGALDEGDLARVAGIKQRAEAKLAELEILHRDRLAKIADPIEQEAERNEYRRDRERIRDRCDRDVREIRGSR